MAIMAMAWGTLEVQWMEDKTHHSMRHIEEAVDGAFMTLIWGYQHDWHWSASGAATRSGSSACASTTIARPSRRRVAAPEEEPADAIIDLVHQVKAGAGGHVESIDAALLIECLQRPDVAEYGYQAATARARVAQQPDPHRMGLLFVHPTQGGLLAACTGLRMLLMEKVKGWFADHPTWLAKYYELLAQLAVVPKAVRDRIYSAIVSDEQTREMRKHRR